MKIIKANNLICPIDGEKLSLNEKQFICENGHSYDVAKQGYVNLLPVQHKRSKHPGDSKEMVVARTNFLSSGVYEPIAKKLADVTMSYLEHQSESYLMDAGCGEGYYFDYLFNTLQSSDGSNGCSFIGLDISKFAIIDAAKKNKNITWIVGTNRQPPIENKSVDIILCVFGFHSFEGFKAILKDNGKIILVEPGAEHLKELRDIIYSEVKVTEPPDLNVAKELGFSLVDTQKLKFKTGKINNLEINQLLLMTPHFFRANKQGQIAAAELQEINLTVDVVFRVLGNIT